MKLTAHILNNQAGDHIEITNFGARLVSWYTRLEQESRNIILGYENLKAYLDDPYLHGAIVGPYANRIGNGQVKLEGKIVQLDQNQPPHHLHGGSQNLSNQLWTPVAQEVNSLTLKCELAAGLSGYPGHRTFWVTYTLSDESCLSIQIQAETDQTSIIGPTSHPYFNLAGFGNPHKGHKLQLFSEQYTQLDSMGIATGEIASSLESELDFRQARVLNEALDKDQLDHNFIHNKTLGSQQARLTSPDNKLTLAVSSDYPGLQVYTGNYLTGQFEAQSGICLEPQFYPDSPNHAHFPYQNTQANTLFEKTIHYQLIK